MSVATLRPDTLQRMEAAVDEVQNRAVRAAARLAEDGIDYAIVGGHAVAAWVAQVDPEAVRNTKDVDILIDRQRLTDVIRSLAREGFVHHNVDGIDLFIDGPDGSVRSGIHVVFAGEKVRGEHPTPAPGLGRTVDGTDFRVVDLEGLVQMKLAAFRLKDQVHLIDLIDVGLLDESWCDRVAEPLRDRLREVFERAEAER